MGIREINILKNPDGTYKQVHITFGPHFALELTTKGKKTSFSLVATHHGFKADASTLNGELEKLIEEVREKHPENRWD